MTVNIQQLKKGWQPYFQLGLSPSTRKAYQSGLHIYKAKLNARVTSTSEITLILFISHLANKHANVEHANIDQAYSPRLQQVMKGVQPSQNPGKSVSHLLSPSCHRYSDCRPRSQILITTGC